MALVFGGLVLGVCAGLGLAGLIGPGQAAEPPRLVPQIAADGTAQFLWLRGAARSLGWSVTCRQPLRGCLARGQGGAVLWADGDGSVRLGLPHAAGARLSVRRGNRMQDLGPLLDHPLAPETLDRLDQPDTWLVVEEQGAVALTLPVPGLADVAAYLRFLEGPVARTLRDARVWHRTGQLDPDSMEAAVLDRYRQVENRALQPQPVLVPVTKPQSEFAQRAQGGQGLFTASGAWSGAPLSR